MRENTQTYLLNDARKALKNKHLLSALYSLQGAAHSLKAWNEAEEVSALLKSYRIMLNYLAKGTDDPERNRMYDDFIRKAHETCDVLERETELQDPASSYAANFKTQPTNVINPDTLQTATVNDGTYRFLFDLIAYSGKFTSDTEIAVNDCLTNTDVRVEAKSLVLSALTLSAMRFFDIAKYRLLLDNVLNADCTLRVRAIVGLIFVHLIHTERLELYPDVTARLTLLTDIPEFTGALELLQFQLFLSLETKKIEKNLRENIIPQMMKSIKHLRLDRSLGLDDLKEKLSEAELNPDWKESMSSLGADYVKELIDLQQRGADMYMSSFKMLKQRFPFFNIPSNWFWPFSYSHPDIPQSAKKNRTINMLINHTGLCDSDKYSLCLMAEHLPGFDARIFGLQDFDMPEENAEAGDVLPKDGQTTLKENLRSYVQGFYRFCNLYVRREAFVNPFQRNLFIFDCPPFSHLLKHNDFSIRMADFMFQNKSYRFASDLLQRVPLHQMTAALYQKLGFCHEQQGDIPSAVQAYRQANELKPRSAWTLRRLAACSRMNANYEEALCFYDKLEELYPEDAQIASRQAECLIHLNAYDKAIKYLFKADYLASSTANTARAIAWCSLLMKNYGQAEKYYQKVLQDKPTPTDWLNAGHAAWLGGNTPLAVERYVKALPAENPATFLDDDAEMLKAAGQTEKDLNLMTDAVLQQSHGNEGL